MLLKQGLQLQVLGGNLEFIGSFFLIVIIQPTLCRRLQTREKVFQIKDVPGGNYLVLKIDNILREFKKSDYQQQQKNAARRYLRQAYQTNTPGSMYSSVGQNQGIIVSSILLVVIIIIAIVLLLRALKRHETRGRVVAAFMDEGQENRLRAVHANNLTQRKSLSKYVVKGKKFIYHDKQQSGGQQSENDQPKLVDLKLFVNMYSQVVVKIYILHAPTDRSSFQSAFLNYSTSPPPASPFMMPQKFASPAVQVNTGSEHRRGLRVPVQNPQEPIMSQSRSAASFTRNLYQQAGVGSSHNNSAEAGRVRSKILDPEVIKNQISCGLSIQLSENIENVCLVCLDEFEEGDIIIQPTCTHKYHDRCLQSWLHKGHPTCPTCRQEFDMFKPDQYRSMRQAELSCRGSMQIYRMSRNHSYQSPNAIQNINDNLLQQRSQSQHHPPPVTGPQNLPRRKRFLWFSRFRGNDNRNNNGNNNGSIINSSNGNNNNSNNVSRNNSNNGNSSSNYSNVNINNNRSYSNYRSRRIRNYSNYGSLNNEGRRRSSVNRARSSQQIMNEVRQESITESQEALVNSERTIHIPDQIEMTHM